MEKLKLVVALVIAGILGLQSISIAKDLSKNQIKKDQSNYNIKKETTMNAPNKFEFQPLPYAYDSLEPFIDKLTVEIHYSKHHKAYYDNFINAIKGTEMEARDIKDIFKNVSKYPVAARNNSGGYFNHTFYWESMKANGGGLSTGKLLQKHLAPLMSSRNNFQMPAKLDLAAVGHGYALMIKEVYLFAPHQTRIIR